MKKIYKLIFTVALLMSAVIQLAAQVNGTAVVPTVSTLASPLYYYIESAANGTTPVLTNNNAPDDLRGYVMICPSTSGSKISWGALTDTNKDAALWAVVNDGGVIKLVNKAYPTLFMFQSNFASTTANEVKYDPRVSPNQLQYKIYSTGYNPVIAWNAFSCDKYSDQGVNTKTSWYFILPFESERTVNVSSANTLQGTAVITGTTDITKTSMGSISITANPLPGYVFVNWTNQSNGDIVSTESPYYVGANSINLIANFTQIGTVGQPFVSTTSNPIYYYIQSACNGSNVFSSFTGDFRSNVLISPTAAGRIIHKRINAVTTPDHALWMLENVGGTILLKNKATGFYMVGSRDAGTTTTGNGFTPTLQGNNQYTIKTADAGTPNTSTTNVWRANLCDRLFFASDPGENSLISWYFVVAPESATNYQNALISTGVSDVNKSDYSINTVNRTITVEGVNNFEVYSVTGQKQNREKALQSGVYLVKIKDFTQKVIVK